MKHKSFADNRFAASVKAGSGVAEGSIIRGRWKIECRGPDGKIKWVDYIENLVVDEGLDHLLDVTLAGGTQITSWFVGLTDGTPTVAAGDTMASHAGWAEVTAYSEAARQGWTAGAVSDKSVDRRCVVG